MNKKTEFKSLITNDILSLHIPIQNQNQNQNQMCKLFPLIKSQLLSQLELDKYQYTIKLYTLSKNQIKECDKTSFHLLCDCIEYPAFLFKPILRSELVDTNIVQQ